uniref:ARAD1D29832p n=1 Tax=Blastobotrys adeninivorans TaxID=409370 RepID=A0A060TAX5_BLAAD
MSESPATAMMNGSVDKAEHPGTITPSTVEINGSVNGAAGSPNAHGSALATPNGVSPGKRIEMDSMMADFQKNLGPKWDKYRDTVTHFLIGKLTRVELQQELEPILDKNMIRMHNHFMLANLANALRDGPQGEGGSGILSGWSKKSRDGPSRNVKGDSQLAKIKEDIMGLSVRERKRIKAVAKESSKRAPLPSAVTATRQAILPKIPFVSNDKDSSDQKHQQQQQQQTQQTQDAKIANGTSQTWTQDIIHSYEAPLASETYELPDNDTLAARMLGISLEQGLLQGVDKNCPELLLVGLEQYLKDLLQETVTRVRLRKRGATNDCLTAEDFAMVLESSATCFVEMNGPTEKLRDVYLADEHTDEEKEVADNDVVMEEASNGGSADHNDPGLKQLLHEILASH